MAISFLIPLAIALIAIYIRSHNQEEIIRLLSTIIAVISVCLSLALAPGRFQILVLVVTVWKVWRCCRESCKNPASPC